MLGTRVVFVRNKCLSSEKTAEITAILISSASAAAVGYVCKNLILSLVSSFCALMGLCMVVSPAV